MTESNHLALYDSARAVLSKAVRVDEWSAARAPVRQRREKQKAKQKQQAPTNGAAKPELRPATVEKKPDAAPRRLSLADLRAAAKARQAVV